MPRPERNNCLSRTSADIIPYQASFHHVPADSMAAARECRRVLKSGGRAIFVEPVYRAGAYTEITRLVEEEETAQKKAYAAICSLAESGLTLEKEDFFYLERSFADYNRLIEFFVEDAARRVAVLDKARKITEQFSAAAGWLRPVPLPFHLPPEHTAERTLPGGGRRERHYELSASAECAAGACRRLPTFTLRKMLWTWI
jgi:SAM-dependent methyltransferase